MNDNIKIAESIAEKLNFNTIREFLVKPLDPVKVKKEFTVPVPAKEQKGKDENGIDAIDFNETKTEVKEVDSDYRKGIVIKVPYDYTKWDESEKVKSMPIHVGDTIIFPAKSARIFDLFKDSALVREYDIVAVETNA